jgi:hypothetical protein
VPGNRQCVTLDATEFTSRFTEPFPQFLSLKNAITKRACKFGPPIAHLIGMDFEKMKALMETSREESVAQREPQVEEFPKPDSGPDWTYLGHDAAKERIAA